jgi:TetR/AcrR family transcriptional regulator
MPTMVEPPEVIARILDAAAEEFGDCGFSGARVDGIAKRAGVNKAMLYYHVGDKKTLFSHVILRTIGEVSQTLGKRLDGELTTEGRIRAFILNLTEAVSTRKWLPGLMMREAAGGGKDLTPEAALAVREMFGFFQNELKAGIASGRIREVDTVVAHLLGLGGVLFFFSAASVIAGYLPEGSRSDRKTSELASAVSDILLNGLLNAESVVRVDQGGLMRICLPL